MAESSGLRGQGLRPRVQGLWGLGFRLRGGLRDEDFARFLQNSEDFDKLLRFMLSPMQRLVGPWSIP